MSLSALLKQHRQNQPTFQWKPFSIKQMKLHNWWHPKSPVKDKDYIFCDGSIRSGKSLNGSFSYVNFCHYMFDGDILFGMAGKTIGSFKQNVLRDLDSALRSAGFKTEYKTDEKLYIVYKDGKFTVFEIFGGKDEGSQQLIQGRTLGSMFFDEAVLMPESFINQATGRTSIDGAKSWFNCNPGNPFHFLKQEYIDKAKEKNVLRMHFTMNDNLALSDNVKARYERNYSGVFYKRYIQGLWVVAEGLVYDMYDPEINMISEKDLPCRKDAFGQYWVSIDYGTANPTVFGLFAKYDRRSYLLDEYHHSGRVEAEKIGGEAKLDGRAQKTDAEYRRDLSAFLNRNKLSKENVRIIVDPSALSFITELKKNGFSVMPAKNEVLDGIRTISIKLAERQFFILDHCKYTNQEFQTYAWDTNAQNRGEDKPIKANDHAMDMIRYFFNTVPDQQFKFFEIKQERVV